MRDHLILYLNGQRHLVRGPAALRPLAEWLRYDLGLTGTKIVCNEGDCGACTLLAGRPDATGQLVYRGIDSCLLAVAQVDGHHLVTVEGLADAGRPDPLQQAVIDQHGSQCGYCTPGFVMTLASLAESGTTADDEAVRQGLSGNICRCTGYLPLIEAGRTICAAGRRPASQRYTDPAIAADLAHAIREPLRITTDRAEFVVPTTLHVACEYKTNYPDARIAAGGTELGVWRNKRGEEPGRWLSLQRINELNGVVVADGRARFAANATWAEVESFARDHLPVYGPIVRRFASPQIRAVATLAGNVANGSPIADSLGLLAACEAEVELVSIRGRRVVPITGFYHGYKRNDLAADEMIAAVVLPLPGPREHLHVTKVSKRLDMDIASFGSGIRLRLADDTIEQAWIAYTGVAPTVVRLPQTEAFLAGQPFTETTFAEAGRLARSEIDPITDVRGSRDFRLLLAENVLRKCYHELAGEPVGVNGTY